MDKSDIRAQSAQISYAPESVKASATTTKTGAHRLEIEHKKSMYVTGVKDVPVFSDKTMTIKLDGETLVVQGQGLSVKSLDVEGGNLSVLGTVHSLKYSSQAAPASLIKRIFK